jgi:hypothetical protein
LNRPKASSWRVINMIFPKCDHENREQELARVQPQGMKAVNDEGSAVNVVGDTGIEAQFLDCASINGKVDHGF